MKVRIRGACAVFACALFFLSPLVTRAQFTGFSGGNGTIGDPYQITTAVELAGLNDYSGAGADNYYVLANDISLEVGSEWIPIGSDGSRFQGHFDGAGHTISNVYIHAPVDNFAGLFGVVDYGATVINLVLSNVDISAPANSWLGGVAGFNYGYISRAQVSGSVLGAATYPLEGAGGIAGGNGGTIKKSSADVSVSAYANAGGIAGSNDHEIRLCFSAGSVTVGNGGGGGGVVGNMYSGTIADVYSHSSVTGGDYIGGLAGTASGDLSNAYSTGVVTGPGDNKGGLIGYGSASNSFWDTETSGMDTSIDGIGKTTVELQTEATFSDAGWDMANAWIFSSGYPTVSMAVTTPGVPEVSTGDTNTHSISLWWWVEDDGGMPVVEYEVRYRLIDGGEWITENVSDTEYEITADPGEYEIEVRALNSIGSSDAATLTATIDTSVPGPEETIISNQFQGGGEAQGWNADDEYWSYELPFPFSFYGQTYNTVYVSSNGYVGFSEDGDMSDYNFSLSEGNGSPIIAAMENDLLTDENEGDDIYITDNGDGKVIFRWQATDIDNSDSVANFEIVLNADNTFQLNYGEQTSPINDGSAVGVNNGNGSYVESVYNDRTDFNQLDTSSWDANIGEPINEGPTEEKFQADIIAGFITVDGDSPSSADKVTFNVDYTIIAGDAKVVLLAGTEMTNKSTGEPLDFTAMDFEDITQSLKNATTSNIAGAVSIGIPGLNLAFSKNITITIPVDGALNGQIVNIYFQNAGSSDWSGGLTCLVADGVCVFETNHATKYSAGDKPTGDADSEEEAQKAYIDSWSAYQYKDDSHCEVRLRVDIKGKHFDDDAEVKIGGAEASSVDVKNSKKIVAKFCLTKLLDNQVRRKRVLSVINPDAEKETADKKINLKQINYDLSDVNFDQQTVEGVMGIQRALVSLGLLDQQYVTGTFGPITAEAVKNFQSQNGIEQTGFVGPLTKAKLVEKVK